MVVINTKIDILHVFLSKLGSRQPEWLLVAMVMNEPGVLHDITKTINKLEGNIIALSTYSVKDIVGVKITMKFDHIDGQDLRKSILPFVNQI